MSRFRLMPLFCVAAMLSTGAAFASSSAAEAPSMGPTSAPALNIAPAQTTSKAPSYSSSEWSSSLATSETAEFRAPSFSSSALPSAPAPSASAGGQNDNGNNGGRWQRAAGGLAFEGGFGFNAPKSDSIGWGWNLLVGAGIHAGSHFTPMIEYQFIRTGLAQYIINEAGSQGGYTHLWSFTVDPVYDIAPKASNDFYIKGGGGFYRKVTSFTDPQQSYYCDYFYGCYPTTVNQVVGHFSSNQGGWNIGGGYYHRFGGIYGTSKMKFFAEARYLDVLTPAVIGHDQNGNTVTSVPADTKLIPVTFGFSW